jgi:hypothetical protein
MILHPSLSRSRTLAALAVVFLAVISACGVSDEGGPAKKDASSDARGGAAGKGVGGAAGKGTAGDFGTGGQSGDLGVGGAAGIDTTMEAGTDADMDAAVADEPPPMCPADATPIDGTGKGLKGEYFIGQNFDTLKVTRYDPQVNFNWGPRAPEVGMPADHFSIRWTGQIQPRYSDSYTFYVNSDDGARVTINNMVVYDHFSDHGAMEEAGTPITLVGGQKYDIKIEYYENGADASMQLSWESLCQLKEVVPQSQLYYTAPVCAATTNDAGTGTGLKGEYYDNIDLTNLLATHAGEAVDFTWAAGVMPDPAIAPGTYSIRWSGQVQARYTESVTFSVTSDDGARLFVDDVLVVNDWNDHAATEDSGTINVVAGQKYNVRLELYENGGGAQVKLAWSSGCIAKETIPLAQLYPTYTGVVCAAPSVGTGTGLKGDYYNAPDFTDLKVTHATEAVDFDFGANAPDPLVGADNFSIRWTGQIQARYSGPTTFHTISDDGVRLWIGGVLVIDDWVDHGPTEDTAVVTMTAGQKYDVRVDYHETGGGATIRLDWDGPCQPLQAVPATMLYSTGYTGVDAGSAIDTGVAPADAGADVSTE